MKKLLMSCLSVLLLATLGGCGKDAEHITKEEAQLIAEGLIGSEVTYVGEENTDEKTIVYEFTDSKGVPFTVLSSMSQGNIDGAAFGPYYCWVSDDYRESVLQYHLEAVKGILEKYELASYAKLEDIFCVRLEVYEGTAEENRDFLKRAAAAGAEIDALLDITFDKDYKEKTKKKDYTFSSNLDVRFMIVINRKLVGKDLDEISIDGASIEFSVSEGERWTADSMYEAILKEIDTAEVAK